MPTATNSVHFLKRWTTQWSIAFTQQTSIAPLVILRIAFGAIMFISTMRFIDKGWVVEYYVKPIFNFTYYGFEWVKPLGETGMFILFYTMAVAALLVLVGLFYRVAIVVFFLCFTYAELIDKTTYLNHYYFVSIVSFLMIWVPAHRYFSLDTWRKPSLKVTLIPAGFILIFKLQLFLIYFFAGLSKINYDWLIQAMPLKIWLPANTHWFLIGPLMKEEWIAYVFSWGGLFFDLFIGFVLFNKKTVYIGYFFVAIFHVFTALMFPIGMFPYIMMSMTLIFFSNHFHQSIINVLRKFAGRKIADEIPTPLFISSLHRKFIYGLMTLYFMIQFCLPLRYLLYPDSLFWTEEGFRYSWRVMLMEKTGITFFHVKDIEKGESREIINSIFLTPFQERMMSTQPDMILQYAHFLHDTYEMGGIKDPVVTVESYVMLNGSASQLFIDKQVNLAKENESFRHKAWILPHVHPKFVRCAR
ncbi:MAG: deoxyribonuclease HsdR [Chitinophagaceae bacterium]|nr:deoxyribonuclease HsdR [Chitinophagaceae bacterium]